MQANGPQTPRPIGSRQACSLLLLTATLVGSCVALAVRTLLESGSGMLLVLLTLGFMASMLSVLLTFTRRHIRQRRDAGYTTACFDCIQIRPEWAAPTPPALNASPPGRFVSSTHREQMELSVRSALTALPEAPFDGANADAEPECSLCMEALIVGEMVRTLPSCGHCYHTK